MAVMTTEWARVGECIRNRLLELGLNQAELVRKSGVSHVTVRAVMEGEPGNPRPSTLAKISKALDWPHDAIDRLLDGADIADIEPVHDIRSEDGKDYTGIVSSLSPESRAAIDRIIELEIRSRRG